MGEQAPFTVETPGRGKLEVKVKGPRSTAQVNVKQSGNGVYQVSYCPTEPGDYEVHVTLDGKHIPGSLEYFHLFTREHLPRACVGTGKLGRGRENSRFLHDHHPHEREDPPFARTARGTWRVPKRKLNLGVEEVDTLATRL